MAAQKLTDFRKGVGQYLDSERLRWPVLLLFPPNFVPDPRLLDDLRREFQAVRTVPIIRIIRLH